MRRDADGATLLHVICGWADAEELVAFLIDAGIPVDATVRAVLMWCLSTATTTTLTCAKTTQDDAGWTPLLEAAQEGQVETCRVLLPCPRTARRPSDRAASPGRAHRVSARSQGRRWTTGWEVRLDRAQPPSPDQPCEPSFARTQVRIGDPTRDDDDNNAHEYQCIVFMVAAVLFHECAHLTLRWKGVLDSPSEYMDNVGAYMEYFVFQGECALQIESHNSREWTSAMPIRNVVIRKPRGVDRVLRRDYLRQFFAAGPLDGDALFPLKLDDLPRIQGACVHDGSRRAPTPMYNPSAWVP